MVSLDHLCDCINVHFLPYRMNNRFSILITQLNKYIIDLVNLKTFYSLGTILTYYLLTIYTFHVGFIVTNIRELAAGVLRSRKKWLEFSFLILSQSHVRQDNICEIQLILCGLFSMEKQCNPSSNKAAINIFFAYKTYSLDFMYCSTLYDYDDSSICFCAF